MTFGNNFLSRFVDPKGPTPFVVAFLIMAVCVALLFVLGGSAISAVIGIAIAVVGVIAFMLTAEAMDDN